MNNRQRILNLLGLAMRAGELITGESLSLNAIAGNKAKMAFIASNASENTKKKFKNKTEYYEVPLVDIFSKEELSHAIGKNRTSIALVDKGFTKSIKELIENM